MSSSLDLTKRLREIDDTHLSALLRSRITHPSGLKDYFDVADALLTENSLMKFLQQLTGSQLHELLDLTTASSGLRESITWQLLDNPETAQLYPEALELVQGIESPLTQSEPVEPVSGSHNQAALENALTAMSALEELGRVLIHSPAKTLATGGLSSPEFARLKAFIPADTDVEALLDLGEIVGIFAHNGRWWVATQDFIAWQLLTPENRWLASVKAWESGLSPAISQLLREAPTLPPADSWLEARFPLKSDWVDAPLASAITQAQLLGLIVGAKLGETGLAVLSQNWEVALKHIGAAVPVTVEHVFIQHDFTVVAPGPLVSELDSFIRSLCVVETRGVATTFRITTEGVDSLLAQGFTSEELIEKLRRASSTPLPQAVEYFVSDRAEKFGSIRVQSTQSGSTISCRDELLATTLLSDRNLNALGLRRHSEHVVVCVHPEHVVLRALQEAKYSALAVDAAGEVIPHATGLPLEPRAEQTDAYDDLVTRLRSLASEELTDDATWISRQLELAVREKAVVTVTVNMPDGPKDFFVEARSFANGRLRCLDRATEVERTLPASHITEVRKVS